MVESKSIMLQWHMEAKALAKDSPSTAIKGTKPVNL